MKHFIMKSEQIERRKNPVLSFDSLRRNARMKKNYWKKVLCSALALALFTGTALPAAAEPQPDWIPVDY